MSARTFISFMLILMVLTSVLLAFSKQDQAKQENQCPSGTSRDSGTQVQTDGSMILESVSRHLLSAVQ